jgi:hypothetical protein
MLGDGGRQIGSPSRTWLREKCRRPNAGSPDHADHPFTGALQFGARADPRLGRGYERPGDLFQVAVAALKTFSNVATRAFGGSGDELEGDMRCRRGVLRQQRCSMPVSAKSLPITLKTPGLMHPPIEDELPAVLRLVTRVAQRALLGSVLHGLDCAGQTGVFGTSAKIRHRNERTNSTNRARHENLGSAQLR